MMQQIKKYTGIWIDHRQAYIVFIKDDQINIGHIDSGIHSPAKSSGGSLSETAVGDRIPEIRSKNQFRHQLVNYYNDIITRLERPDAMVVFGPGKAKREFLKRIEDSHLSNVKIAGIETVDKMTENQITAYVKDFFQIG